MNGMVRQMQRCLGSQQFVSFGIPFEQSFRRRVLPIPSSRDKFNLQDSSLARNGRPIDISCGTSSIVGSILGSTVPVRKVYCSRISPRILASSRPLTKPSRPSITTTDPSSSSSSSSPSGKSSSVTAGTCQVSDGKNGGNERCRAVLLCQ
jgi:hypothetical protein